MNANNAVLIVLIIGLAVIGVLIFSKSNNTNLTSLSSPSPEVTTVYEEPPSPSETVKSPINVVLNSSNKNNKQSGAAVLSESNGKVTIVINAIPVVKTSSQTVSINSGDCSNLGKTIYQLNNLVKGKSTTLIDTNLQELTAKIPLAISIHEPNSSSNAYIACGSVKK